MNKYRNKKTVVDGITFDSRKEAKRYNELKLLQMGKIISGLELQKSFELIPAQYEEVETVTPKKQIKKIKKRLIERPVNYIADFCYRDDNGNYIVEDTKGKRTKEYIIKRKLMLYIHGIKIKEV